MSRYHKNARVNAWVEFCTEKHIEMVRLDKKPLCDFPEEWHPFNFGEYKQLCDNPRISLRKCRAGTALVFGDIGNIYETDFILTKEQTVYLKLTNGKNWEAVVPEVPVK